MYKSVRVRLASIGCTLVRHFNTAHDDGATNNKSFRLFLRRQRGIVETPENRIDLTHNGPIRWNSDLDPTPHRKHFQYGFVGSRNPGGSQIDFAATHHGGRAAASEVLGIIAAFDTAQNSHRRENRI